MKAENIKTLLDRFYNGESTEEQEKLLLEYFQHGKVADELAEEKEIFLQLYLSQDYIEVPAGLEGKINDLIDELASKEDKRTIALNSVNKRRQFITRIRVAAACIAIIIATTVFIDYRLTPEPPTIVQVTPQDTYTDPTQAYLEARKALMEVSANFNKGIGQLASVEKDIDKTNDILNKSIYIIKE